MLIELIVVIAILATTLFPILQKGMNCWGAVTSSKNFRYLVS